MTTAFFRQLDLWEARQERRATSPSTDRGRARTANRATAYPLWMWRSGVVLPRRRND
jgi:hypothetical protein